MHNLLNAYSLGYLQPTADHNMPTVFKATKPGDGVSVNMGLERVADSCWTSLRCFDIVGWVTGHTNLPILKVKIDAWAQCPLE